jgi:hypothetical protein
LLDDKSELEPLDPDQPIPFSEIEKSDHDIHEAPEREKDSLKTKNKLDIVQSHDAGFE